MNKDNLLKHIAETGYNVGYGAKKHFATYDIVEKTPGYISFFSMAFGIYALAFDGLSTKFLSASFIVLGVIGLYISFYDSKKLKYEESGKKLTKLFNKLKVLYYKVKTLESEDLSIVETELKEIENDYYESGISKQILLSDWYAHYKFFWQHQIDWIDEQKNFSFFRDKVPLSFHLFIFILIILMVCNYFHFFDQFCSLTFESNIAN